MKNYNGKIDQNAQLEKIMEDTEEIIQSFKMISEMVTERLYSNSTTLRNLGRRTVNARIQKWKITEQETIL